MTNALASAVAAFERKDPTLALSSVLEAWRERRDPELAVAIEALSRALPQRSLMPTRTARERWSVLEARAPLDEPGDFELISAVELPRALDAAITDELAACEGLPHLQRIEVVHSSWVRGLDDLVELATSPVARRLGAVALTIGATTFELVLLGRGERRLRLVLRPFDRKDPVARFTDVDDSDRADLALLTALPSLVEVEVVVAAPLPDGFDAWLERLLDQLPDLSRRITHPG